MPRDFEVFRAGRYPQGDFPIETVQQIVADYNPAYLEAAVTLDHEQWGPAFGWVRGVRLAGGDTITASLDLHPMLEAAYRDGQYKKRSIEILPAHKSPTGRPYLTAVTFLGARTPQVPALADPQFSNPDERLFVDFDERIVFNNEGGGPMSKFKETLKKFFSKAVDEIDEKELGVGESPLPAAPAPATTIPPPAQFAVSEASAKFAAVEAENKKLKEQNAQLSQAKRNEEIHTFCEGLKREGKLLPAWQEMGIEKFMLALSQPDGLSQTNGTMKFSSAADAKEETLSVFFRSFLQGLPKLVEFGKVAADGAAGAGAGGDDAEPDEHEFMAVARQFSLDKKISLSAAMSHVVKKQPELHAAFLEHCSATARK